MAIDPKEDVYHDISLTTGGSGVPYLSATKEIVTITFNTTWRGRPAVVRMEANRYAYGNHPLEGGGKWSEWRIYADRAREGDDLYQGADLTDLARGRLSKELQPSVVEWLASDAYGPSREHGFWRAIRNFAREMRGYGDPPSSDLRRAIKVNESELSDDHKARLLIAADSYDLFIGSLGEQ